jgi:hypothetical protein
MTTIQLNVGGMSYVTLKSTLIKCKYFESLFRFDNNPKEPIFIDCDPEGFKHILEHLRFANYTIPANFKYLCKYFMIDENACVETIIIKRYNDHTIGKAMYKIEELLSSGTSQTIKSKKIFEIMSKIIDVKELDMFVDIKLFYGRETSMLVGPSYFYGDIKGIFQKLGLGLIPLNSGTVEGYIKSFISLLKTNPKWEVIQILDCYVW